ncbi:MAG: PQQ-binding-like beta-propeller repeat protein [Treponema sp.]|nr:PQQ-binding-like beta-propeller repeat protein [Treponema sp.]
MKTGNIRARRVFLLAGFFVFVFLSPGFLGAQSSGTAAAPKRVTPSSMQVAAAPVWNQDLGDLVYGQPYLQAESAVVACTQGSIKSFYLTGTPLWSFDPQDAVTPFIARSVEGAAYICNKAGSFKAVNRVGRELWRINLSTPISYPPVVGWDGRVFICVGSEVICRTAAGRPLWSIDLGSPMAVAPQLDHAGSLVTVLENRDFVRVGQFSNVERIRLDRHPLLIVSLKSDVQDGYVLFYPSGETEKISYSEKAARGGKLSRSSFPTLPAVPAAAVSKGEQYAVTLKDGRVQFMDGSGKVLWTGNTHETAVEKGPANLDKDHAAMVFDERGVYSISTRGATGFAVDGRRRFILKIAEASSIPGLSDEGILYVCGKDKSLYAYKLDSKPRNVPRSRYYGPDPEGSYGMGNPPPSPWSTDNHRFQDDQQALMYATISKAIDSGQLGEAEPVYVAYLMEMIGFFLNDPHYSRVRPAVKPPQRVALIRLLGKVGSRETVPFLWMIFDKDQEPSIKAACAEAIGTIGVDPKGSTFESYNFLLAANNPNRDPQLLMSATSSIAALCRFSGPPLSGEGILLLRYFASLTWAPNTVKAQIKNELDALYKEGLDSVIQ